MIRRLTLTIYTLFGNYIFNVLFFFFLLYVYLMTSCFIKQLFLFSQKKLFVYNRRRVELKYKLKIPLDVPRNVRVLLCYRKV